MTTPPARVTVEDVRKFAEERMKAMQAWAKEADLFNWPEAYKCARRGEGELAGIIAFIDGDAGCPLGDAASEQNPRTDAEK